MARKTYPDSFKRDAVKLMADKGYSLAKASEATGVPIATLSLWKNNLLPVDQAELKAENDRLAKRVKELEMERDILKKAATFFAKESK